MRIFFAPIRLATVQALFYKGIHAGYVSKELIETPELLLTKKVLGNNPGDAFCIGTIDTAGKQRAFIQASRCLFFKGLLKNSFETAKAF
ncbi:hypothetical protein CEXT_404061 [Caerostris extrusa]|uniref:Uncharacterized protein n=1 Tax=Caerostris extrusa TaxID=172846 RepID=A0AAV4WRM6_CAEEX|nr:hypothetical protein CEXT_404061 [Caerostris extrusa]